MEETTRAATANLNTRAAGRGPAATWRAQSGATEKRGPPPLERDCPPPEHRRLGERQCQEAEGYKLPGGGAEESYPANTTPGGTGGEVEGRLSLAALPPRAADSEQGGEEKGS